MEVTVKINNEIMNNLRNDLGISTSVGVINEALTLLHWATEEAKKGRIILSSNINGKDVSRLIMHSLLKADVISKSSKKN